MKICFVDTVNIDYSYKDINNYKIRGAESILINLSKSISETGIEVTIFNNCKNEISFKNYNWLNINKIKNYKNNFDIVISNNDTNALDVFNCKKKFVISHSILSLEKGIRKKQIISYFINRPKYLLLGNYHKSKMSKLFTFFGSSIIDYGVDKIFEHKELNNIIDNDLSYFTSRQDRNLDMLIDIWKQKIINSRNSSKLYITPLNQDLKKYNIFNRKMLERSNYIEEIIKSRMIILPGHKAELYCLSALEAAELCIPIVTMGIGSLSERVEHNITGLVSKNSDSFAKNVLEMYKNDQLWNEIRSNLIARRGQNSWNKATQKFIKIIKEL